MPPPRSSLANQLGPLQDYFARNQVIPTVTDLRKLWNLESLSWTHTLLQRMKEQGYVEEASGKRLRPGPRFFERAVADTVRAGLPEEAHEVQPEVLTIDHFLIDKPSETVLFKVKGDSMQDAGILEGDFVVIERTGTANPGDIILAFVDQEFTLKTLAKDKKGFFLEAANRAYAPIRPATALEIYGVMIGMFRKTGPTKLGLSRPRR